LRFFEIARCGIEADVKICPFGDFDTDLGEKLPPDLIIFSSRVARFGPGLEVGISTGCWLSGTRE